MVAARFLFADTAGVMLLAIFPIALLGIMHGFRVGLLSAVAATGAYEVWILTNGVDDSFLQIVEIPATFFVLGGVSGYAVGALGDFDLRRATLRAELRAGIRAGEIELHYQPIVNAKTGAVVAVEALARRRHPKRGLLGPSEFVPLAEGDPETIRELTMAVIEIATRDMEPLLLGPWPKLELSINVAAPNLVQPEIFEHLVKCTGERRIPLEQIRLEVTESSLINNGSVAAEALGSIRRQGAGVALDDFGTGFSSLAELGELPVNALKLDRNLRDELAGEMSGMIAPLIVLAHELGLSVVAERVETEHVRDELVRLGADELQGFIFSKPLPIDELADHLDVGSGELPHGPAEEVPVV